MMDASILTITRMNKTRHQLTRETNRATLLRAATLVFGTTGYAASNVRDIVRASGLAPGSFYNNFSSKAAIFQALTSELLAPLIAELRRARQEAQSPAEFIRNSYQAVLDAAQSNPDMARLIARNQNEFRRAFRQGQDRVQIIQDVENDLIAWTSAGHFVPHDTQRMADSMVSLGLDLLVQFVTHPQDVEQQLDFLEWLYLKALTPESERTT